MDLVGSAPHLFRGESHFRNVTTAKWTGTAHRAMVNLGGGPRPTPKTEEGVPIYGINYKDDPAAARRFLGRLGNPFIRVGADRSGRTAIDFGVYGVPETYVVTGDGKIAYRHVGPLTAAAIKATRVKPRRSRVSMGVRRSPWKANIIRKSRSADTRASASGSPTQPRSLASQLTRPYERRP